MNEILYLVLFIFGILNLILFFKIWGMTNDVDEIKGVISSFKVSDLKKAEVETLLGNYETAYKIYYKCFIMEVLNLLQKSESNPTYYDRYYGITVTKYQKYLNALEGNYSIDFEKYNSKEKVKNLIFKN